MGNTLRKPENKVTSKLTEVEKQFGVDLKLTPDNDLELTNTNDFALIAGGKNAGQAVKIRVFVEPGGVLYHPEIGTDLQIGEKVTNAFEIQTQIIRSLSKDPRFEDVQAVVQVRGNTIFVDARVTLANTGQQVPLKFVVTR